MKLFLKLFVLLICWLPLSGQPIYYQENSITSPGTGFPSVVPITGMNNIVFKAGEEITLKPGFEAKSNGGNTTFHAYLVPPISYAELKEKVDGSYVVTIENRLYFRYVEKYHAGDGKLDYKIFNYKNQVIMAGKNYGILAARVITKARGSNFKSVDLSPLLNIPGLQATNAVDCFYLLEIINDKGDRYVLRFKYLPII